MDRELLAKEIQHRRGQLGLPPIIFEVDNFRQEAIKIIQTLPDASDADAVVTKFLLENNNFIAKELKATLTG